MGQGGWVDGEGAAWVGVWVGVGLFVCFCWLVGRAQCCCRPMTS